MLIQSIYYPFEMFSKRRDGVSLRPVVDGPGYESPLNGYATYIDASAILDDGTLHFFATNRSESEDAEIRVKVADAVITSIESAELLSGSDPKAANSFENPNVIISQSFDDINVNNGQMICKLPSLSFTAVTVNPD